MLWYPIATYDFKNKMWSDRYYYLNIYKDESLSDDADTKELLRFISTIPELEINGKFKFKNKASFPFTELLLLNARNVDSWSENDINSKRTNFISITCQKGKHVNFEELKRVFVQIESFLKWILVDEETDEGIENFVIWKPE